ncbi:hypothetical protein SASPL_152065 [Salvia splendens]|uniref:RING-type domain-containing protein n=1 Tax=Salvia splendens TaxID=180675 RepID=A0A8X8W2L1_SALSN|nr:hypothetical protein SASPL_152065 [Salvia splendens]
MIVHGETHLSTFVLIFSTCIFQIWQTIVRFCNFVVDPHHQPQSCESDHGWELDLPVTIFRELEMSDEEEMCSICLVEFEEEDSVTKLPKCGHLFHGECIEKWLDKCRFSCPLCRSSLLRPRSKSWPPPVCVELQLS